jgi:hypothetical protein
MFDAADFLNLVTLSYSGQLRFDGIQADILCLTVTTD